MKTRPDLMGRGVRIWIVALASAIWLSVAFAQTETTEPDYSAWQQVAERAQEAVTAGRASDVALQELRNQLTEWRAIFKDAEDTNANAIETVRSQLTTLGPAPEEGSEPSDIAAERRRLETALDQFEVPVRLAEVAYTEADSLISGIDDILRGRQTEALLSLGPTPLNPVNWPEGLSSLTGTSVLIANEVRAAWDSRVQQGELQRQLPQVLLLLAIAVLLLARGRGWVEYFATMIPERWPGQQSRLLSALVSLGQVFLPFLGVIALIEAAYAAELAGLRGEVILSQLPQAGFLIFASYWLGGRLFPKAESNQAHLHLSALDRAQGRLYAVLLGCVLAFDLVLQDLAAYETWSPEAQATIFFPLYLLAGVLLWRFAALVTHQPEDENTTYRDQFETGLTRVMMAIAVIGPALAAIGYRGAASGLLMPSLVTLQVLAFLMIAHKFLSDLYFLIIGSDEDEQSLVPVFLGVVLLFIALPGLALIWGARESDITEIWGQIRGGLTIGDTRISLAEFITFLLVFLIGYLVTRLLQGVMRNTVLPRTRLDTGARNAMVSGLGYVGIFCAALIAIYSAGIDLSNIALVAGALSVGIGFGLQTIVSNFVSGIILLIERPISEGDWIDVNGHQGYVRDISVRSTRIETFDRTDVIVPNADLVSGTVTNLTRGNTVGRVKVPVGVAYGTDPRRIEKLLIEIARAHPMVLEKPAPFVVFQGFGASSLDFEIRAIIRDVNWVVIVRSDLNFEIAKVFAEENIEIPFAQTDIWLRNPGALRPTKDDPDT